MVKAKMTSENVKGSDRELEQTDKQTSAWNSIKNDERNDSSQTYFGFEKISLLSNSRSRAKKKGEKLHLRESFQCYCTGEKGRN